MPLRRFWLPAALGVVVAVTLVAELAGYVQPDLGFLLDAAARVLDGAKLYVDVVDINPPLIFVLNLPVVWLARIIGISEILVYRLGFMAVLLGSLGVMAWQLGRLIPGDRRLGHQLLLLAAVVLFPLAAQDFGQREHLLLAVTLPYLLASAARASGQPVGKRVGLAIGGCAGLGLALKPHFLLLWLGVEGYVRFVRRGRRREVLPETLAILAVLAVYGASVFIVFPDYLRLLPLLAGWYHRFLYDPLLHLLATGPGAMLVWLALLAFVALRSRAGYPRLWDLLAIGMLAAFVGGAAQEKGLRYHFYPAFGLAVLLLGLIAADARAPFARGIGRIYRAAATGVTAGVAAVVVGRAAMMPFGLEDGGATAKFAALVDLVRAHARGGRLYMMSYHIGSTYPLVNYSGVPSASRFPQLWPLAGIYRDDLMAARPLRYHRPDAMPLGERYFMDAVLDDLEWRRPTLLLVLRPARDLPANGYRRLDYIAYFGRDPRFAHILMRYQRLTEVGDYTVYERIPDGGTRTAPPPSSSPGVQDVLRIDRGGARRGGVNLQFLLAVAAFLVASIVGLRHEWADERPPG